MALTSYIELYYLLDCNYLLQYEVGINVFYFFLYGKSHAIGQYHRHWQRILVANIGYFNKIDEQYNKFKTGWENDL